MRSNNIILIGMPGAGKSTVGILLAKELAMDFIDTDVLIQVREKQSLQQIVNIQGYMALREIEEAMLLAQHYTHHIIATGGSAVYSERGMAKLKTKGTVVFLEVSMTELRRRIDNYEVRGIAKRPDQSFESLFEERYQLYKKYADVTIDCNLGTPSQIALKVAHCLDV